MKPQLQTEIEQREWLGLKALQRCFQSKRTAMKGPGTIMGLRGVSRSTISTSTPRAGLARFQKGRSCLTTTKPISRQTGQATSAEAVVLGLSLGFRGHFHRSVYGQTSDGACALGAFESSKDSNGGCKSSPAHAAGRSTRKQRLMCSRNTHVQASQGCGRAPTQGQEPEVLGVETQHRE